MDYVLFLDSDCDITLEVAESYGAKLISMPYNFEGKEIRPYVDFKEFDYKTFYNKLRTCKELPSTGALSPTTYMEYFEPYLKEGKDILYVHFSAAMSGTFNSMRLAVEELEEKYPNNHVYTIDTYGITVLGYYIARECAQLYKEGKSIKEIQDFAEANKFKRAVYFYADDLKFFAKSGRVSGFAAFFGGLIGIKPIIHIGEDGKMTSIAKGKGREGALQKLVEFVDNLQVDITKSKVVLAHTDALPIVNRLAELLKAKYGEGLDLETVVVNPTAGSHCGPNAVGVCFKSKSR